MVFCPCLHESVIVITIWPICKLETQRPSGPSLFCIPIPGAAAQHHLLGPCCHHLLPGLGTSLCHLHLSVPWPVFLNPFSMRQVWPRASPTLNTSMASHWPLNTAAGSLQAPQPQSSSSSGFLSFFPSVLSPQGLYLCNLQLTVPITSPLLTNPYSPFEKPCIISSGKLSLDSLAGYALS